MLIPALGMTAVAGNAQGVEITDEAPNGVAALAGLRPGDVINAVDGKPVKTPMELASELSSRAVGDKVKLGEGGRVCIGFHDHSFKGTPSCAQNHHSASTWRTATPAPSTMPPRKKVNIIVLLTPEAVVPASWQVPEVTPVTASVPVPSERTLYVPVNDELVERSNTAYPLLMIGLQYTSWVMVTVALLLLGLKLPAVVPVPVKLPAPLKFITPGPTTFFELTVWPPPVKVQVVPAQT
jgi:hypothetical protein